MQMDAGNVPVGYLVFRSKTRSLGEIGDLAQYRVRPLLQTYVPGTVATAPFGSAIRAITVSVDPDKLRSYNLTPQDVVNAVNAGNAISPSGNLYIQGAMPLVPNNAMVRDPKEFGSIPLMPGRNVYLRDVATVADATDLNYGYALVDGRKSIYVPIIKKNTASTLQVVSNVQKAMPVFKGVLPEDVDVSFAFDESPTVVTAVHERGDGGPDRRGADRADDPDLPARLAQRDRGRVQHPDGAAGLAVRPVADGQHDQHHDARRAGAGHRHPGR